MLLARQCHYLIVEKLATLVLAGILKVTFSFRKIRWKRFNDDPKALKHKATKQGLYSVCTSALYLYTVPVIITVKAAQFIGLNSSPPIQISVYLKKTKGKLYLL